MNVRRANLLATAVLASTCLADPATAVPIYRLDATANFSTVTDFSLTFEDLDENALFSIDELQTSSFSGVTIELFSIVQSYGLISEVPEILGITSGSGLDWVFKSFSGSHVVFAVYPFWSYAVRELEPPVTVPEPTTLSLLGLSLAGLGWRMRRQRA